MAKVELKAPIVDEIKGYVSDAKSAVIVDYRGLTDVYKRQLFNYFRSSVYNFFSFFQSKTSYFTNNFDNFNLSCSNFCQLYVELVFLSCTACCVSACCCNDYTCCCRYCLLYTSILSSGPTTITERPE